MPRVGKKGATSSSYANPIDSTSGFSKASSVLERGLKYFGAGVAINSISSRTMSLFRDAGLDWCPSFPKSIYAWARNACLLREYIPVLTGTYSNQAFKMPIVEELMFRVGFQELMLKKIPKALLNRFAPSYAGMVDTTAAKITRVALTALAFSLMHATPPDGKNQ